MRKPFRVLYPMSGNPPTWGHADVLERAARNFEEVVWAVAVHPGKRYLFNREQRLEMMDEYVRHFGLDNVRLETYSGATVRFAQRMGAQLILRGLRNATDLQFEMEQATGNRGIDPEIETIALFTSPRYSVLSSSLIRELALLDENIEAYVHPNVARRIREILREQGLLSGQ